MSRNRYFAQWKAYERKVVVLRKEDFIRKEHFIVLLPVLNSFKCLFIHYTTFVRKYFKPFCAKFRPVCLKSLNKTFLSYEKCSFRDRNIPFAKGMFLSVYSHSVFPRLDLAFQILSASKDVYRYSFFLRSFRDWMNL